VAARGEAQRRLPEDAEFPADAIRRLGYEAVWKGQKSWNGIAILARGAAPIVTRTELPGTRNQAPSSTTSSLR
jgi:exonuclease III